MITERWWNDIDTENTRTKKKRQAI